VRWSYIPKILQAATERCLGATLDILHVSSCRVLKRYLDPTFSLTQPTSTADETSQYHLYAIKGSLDEIVPYSDGKVDWLKKVAWLLFVPKAGSLFTFKNGRTEDWLMKEMTQTDWEPVDDGEPLRGTIYEFRASPPTVNLAQISRRVLDPQAYEFDEDMDEFYEYIGDGNEDEDECVVAEGKPATNDPATFYRAVFARDDGKCVITEQPAKYCKASHLIPKRMDVPSLNTILSSFSEPSAPTDINICHPALRVLLFISLDHSFADYGVGFHKEPHETHVRLLLCSPYSKVLTDFLLISVHSKPNRYIIHNFDGEPYGRAYSGAAFTDIYPPGPPFLHGYRVTLTAHSNVPLPLHGFLDWHYLQCVIGRSGTVSYKNLSGILLHELPYYTKDDGCKIPSSCLQGEASESCQSTSDGASENEITGKVEAAMSCR
jgi:hypothetical protein